MAAGDCPDWPISYDGCPSQDVVDSLEPAAKATFEGMAVDLLRSWTGFGTCPVVMRPCRTECAPPTSTFWGRGPFGRTGAPWAAVNVGSGWFTPTCGSCGQTCSCSGETPVLVLPGPVASVTKVTVDGLVLTGGVDWVLQHGDELRRIGAGWPTCQNMDLPPTEPGTWEVQYVRGAPVPVGGQVAAGLLTVELSKAACNDSSCQLPRRVQSITRQGVSMAILDSFDDIEKGHTGIWLVDSWVASVTKPKRGGTVASPDLRARGRYS